VAGTFGLFLWERLHRAEVEMARTVAVNTLAAAEAFYLLNTRFLVAPVLTPSAALGCWPLPPLAYFSLPLPTPR
jgi:hypothetical protein